MMKNRKQRIGGEFPWKSGANQEAHTLPSFPYCIDESGKLSSEQRTAAVRKVPATCLDLGHQVSMNDNAHEYEDCRQGDEVTRATQLLKAKASVVFCKFHK